MGREFASAAARWAHLDVLGVRPELAVVCDSNPDVLAWYERLEPAPRLVSDYRELLADDSVEAVYCAVPHHLHEEIYTACLRRGKHLLGEKPFGIDLAANGAIGAEIAAHPELLVRCSSELPFYPGGQRVWRWIAGAPLRPRARGALGLPALERPRSGEADQLEATRGRATASTVSWATSGCTRSTCRCARVDPKDVRAILSDVVRGATRRATVDRLRATPGTTRSSSARRSGRRGLPAPDRDEADRAGRDEHLDHRGGRHRGIGGVLDQAAEDAPLAWPTSQAGRRPGASSTSARSRHTRRSPARSSSSASPTRFSRCGLPSSTSSPTVETACANLSTAPRRRRRRRRIASSPRRSSRRRLRRSCR